MNGRTRPKKRKLMNTILAFGFHGMHGAGRLVLVLLALAIIAAVFLLANSDRSDDKKP